VPTSAVSIEGSNVAIASSGSSPGPSTLSASLGIIDRAIPKTRQHHLTHGEVVKVMVLNGLGFVERRLYLYPESLSDIAVDRLLGDGVIPDHLNDDVLGRTLDAIAALSSGIPTLSFAYSIKALGINRDIFGHTNYCMGPTDLDAEGVTSRITSMLDESAAIRNDLAEKIPGVQSAALSAGMGLKRFIGVT